MRDRDLLTEPELFSRLSQQHENAKNPAFDFAVIDEAHRNGLPITAHATYDACIERVVRFGVDCVEHGGSMSDSTVALLVEKGIPVVTTFAPIVQQSQPEIARKFGIPEWKIEERQKAVADPARYDGLIRAAKAGVSIVRIWRCTPSLARNSCSTTCR